MKNPGLSIYFIVVCAACTQKPKEDLFKSTDFTAENLFTNGIEGPAFDELGNLYVVNFKREGTIGIVDANGKADLFIELPKGSTANGIKFNSNGDMLLADYTGHNILKVDMTTRAVSVFAHNDSFNQPNDICINNKDQIFASDPNWADSTGQLWRINPDGSTVLLANDLGTINGVAMSPDNKTLYVNESIQRKLWAFDLDESGNIADRRLLAEFPDFGFGGMKCDRDGNIYACRYGKGVIAVVSPDGTLIREIPLISKKCTNLVFGGENNQTVFVTVQDRKNIEKFENDIPGSN
jgi:gluconolactonase